METIPVVGALLEWITRGSLNSPDFLGPAIFPGYATYAPPEVRVLGLVLAIGALGWALWRWMNGPTFFTGIVVSVLALRLGGTLVATLGSGSYAEPTFAGTLLAGPVGGIYLWSILIYALFRMLRYDRSPGHAGANPMVRIRWGTGTGILTILLALAVPFILYLAGQRGINLTGPAWSLAAEWNPPMYTVLAMGYGRLYRRRGDIRLRFLAWILGLSAIGGWSHWLARTPLAETVLPALWPTGLVILAILQAMLWFPAAGGLSGDRGRR